MKRSIIFSLSTVVLLVLHSFTGWALANAKHDVIHSQLKSLGGAEMQLQYGADGYLRSLSMPAGQSLPQGANRARSLDAGQSAQSFVAQYGSLFGWRADHS